MVTKLEVNIRSLLLNCEELSKDESNFWRLKKYIKSLDTMIEELKADENPTEKAISDYYARLQDLKVITNYLESPAANKKLVSRMKQKESGEDALKEIKQLDNSKHYANLRKELMHEDNLRKRNVASEENMGQAMKYYSEVQEKITEDMLSLTRSLKEQTEIANKIIKKDTEIVTKSTQLSDANINSLSKEAEKLQDHSRRACKCWMWLMIGLVMAVFIVMVLFMKVMKKRT